MLVSDFIVERLIRLRLRHVFGVGGANIEDMFAAVQRHRPEIRAVLGKHEHAAGTAADAYARLSGLGVVMTTSGGGAMNLVHAMAEARASRSPVLAVVGEPPTDLQGRGAFQDTSGKEGAVDARSVFGAVSECCLRVPTAADVPAMLEEALATVLGGARGPAVLLLAKDLQRSEIPVNTAIPTERDDAGRGVPNSAALDLAVSWLDARPIVIIAGDAIARTRSQGLLAQLADRLDALVATAPDARDAFDNRHPRFLGVVGAMGHAPVARAIATAELVVTAGTRLPLLARQGIEAVVGRRRLLSLGARPFLRGSETHEVDGDISVLMRALLARLPATPTRLHRTPAKDQAPNPVEAERPSPAFSPEHRSDRLTPAAVLRVIDRFAPEGSTVLLDAGNTGASAIHWLSAPRGGAWLVAMGMAGMGYTFGAATGAALATGKRCIVVAGDGAFFMHGLEIHTAVEHRLPITYVIFNNRAHGMCLVRERIFLGENAGYNTFGPSHVGAGLRAMFEGLFAADCATRAELAQLFEESLSVEGPSVISVELDEVEVPPFAAFQQQAPSMVTVPRDVHDVDRTT